MKAAIDLFIHGERKRRKAPAAPKVPPPKEVTGLHIPVVALRSPAPAVQRGAGPMSWMPCLMGGSNLEVTTPSTSLKLDEAGLSRPAVATADNRLRGFP